MRQLALPLPLLRQRAFGWASRWNVGRDRKGGSDVGQGQLDAGSHQRPARQENLVLVVDDEPSVAESVELLVQQAGYQALVAHSGQEALAKAGQQWPAVVISDVMMPRMDG